MTRPQTRYQQRKAATTAALRGYVEGTTAAQRRRAMQRRKARGRG